MALNALTIVMPLILSFDKKVHFYKKWKHIFLGILGTATVFIIWDVLFTRQGVWRFNEEYLIGVNILNLPLEEWLFFITVPYACVFVYECIKSYFHFEWSEKKLVRISLILSVFFLLVSVIFFSKTYTSVTAFLCATMLLLHVFRFRAQVLAYFFVAYLISVIPFLLVNGVLTSNPVVIYNNEENLAIRLFTIPIEDLAYSFLLLLMNVSILEWSRNRQFSTFTKRLKAVK